MGSITGLRRFPREQDKEQWSKFGYRVPCLSARPRRIPQEPQRREAPGENGWFSRIGRCINRLLMVSLHKMTRIWAIPHQDEDSLAGADGIDGLQQLPGHKVLAKSVSKASGEAENRDPVSALSTLPLELLIEIMHLLPPEALWSLRQSSLLFFHLVNETGAFRAWHAAPGPKDRYIRFKVKGMTKPERDELVKMLQRDDRAGSNIDDTTENFCAACTKVMNQGEKDPITMKLRETRFCDGCKQRHLCVFFPLESIAKYDASVINELYCVGRLGTATICSHSAKPSTWKSFEHTLPGADYKVVCRDARHKPCLWDRRVLQDYGSACPRLTVHKCYLDDTLELKLKWDQPLLDIDTKHPPSLRDVQKELARLVEAALLRHKPCRHVTDGQQLRAFAHSGICKCFCDPSIKERVPQESSSSMIKDSCTCPRKHYLICRECAATYSWHYKHGRITLSYCYNWSVLYPTSPVWINLLDQGPEELGMLTEETRHLLWCDRPGCATGMRRRWEEMLKEAIWLQDRLYGKQPDKKLDYSMDWKILEAEERTNFYRSKKQDISKGGYYLTPHLIGGLPQVAKEVFKATKAAQVVVRR